ncbi:hypothetical protein ACTG9Q_12815 [Actinokineospora sp. 24-640]
MTRIPKSGSHPVIRASVSAHAAVVPSPQNSASGRYAAGGKLPAT